MNKRNRDIHIVISTILFSFILIYLLAENFLAEAMPIPEWNYSVNPTGSTYSDRAFGVTVDSNNNIIVVGYDRNTTGYFEQWRIMKFDTSGGSLWNETRDINTSYHDRAYGVANVSNNNIIAVGSDYLPGNYQWRIMELDQNKNLLWENASNMSSSSDVAQDVAVDSNNNIIVVGYDTNTTGNYAEWRVMKFDQNRNLLWSKAFDFNITDNDYANSVVVDSSDNITIVGSDKVSGNSQWRIIKLNPNGDHLWNDTINPSNTGIEEARGVAVDSSDNIIVVGNDNLPGNLQWRIRKLDKNKNLLWEKTFDISTLSDNAYSVAVDGNDDIIVVGGDRDATSIQWRIMKLDSNGDSIWNYTNNISATTDEALDVAVDSLSNIIVVGYDRNTTPASDQWRIMKLRPNLPDGYTCNSGYYCESGLCIEGYCRSTCSGTYDGQRCSDSTNNYDSDGICTRINGGWECDKFEASFYNNDYWNDCDKTVNEQQCDSSSLAGGYVQDGSCQGASCCAFDTGGSHGNNCDLDSDCNIANGCGNTGGSASCTSSDYEVVSGYDCVDTCTCNIPSTCYVHEGSAGNNQIACEYCGNTGYHDVDGWNGDTNDYCCDDGDDYNRASDAQYLDNGYGSGDGTTACCLASTDCVDESQCTDTTQTKDADGDGDSDYCNAGTWMDCNDNSHCPSGYSCENNDCKQHYLTVESIIISYWDNQLGGWITSEPLDVPPRAGTNRQMNVTVNIKNSTAVNSCLIRIFNATGSYSNPTIGPLPGTLQRVGTQIQCYLIWNMEYWRTPGSWNVSVDLNGLSADETLIGYWAMDWYNSSGIYDNSTYNNFGIFFNGIGIDNITNGKYGKALQFDGFDDYIDAGNVSNETSLSFTYSVWIKRAIDDYSEQYILSHGKNRTLYIYNKNIRAGAEELGDYIGSTVLQSNIWYYFAFTYNGTNGVIYLNGTVEASGTTAVYLPNGSLYIGQCQHGVHQFNGTIDEVRIWNRTLSPEEIIASYNSGTVSNFTSKNFTYVTLVSIDINVSTINFAGYPGDTVNSINSYPLGVNNTGNKIVNVDINGTNFVGLTDTSYKIGVTNITYSKDKSLFTQLTYSPQLVFSNINIKENKDLYFRVRIPIGYLNQNYQNNINFNATGST